MCVDSSKFCIVSNNQGVHKTKTLCVIFSVGSAAVSWYNRKQRSVELSSIEA